MEIFRARSLAIVVLSFLTVACRVETGYGSKENFSVSYSKTPAMAAPPRANFAKKIFAQYGRSFLIDDEGQVVSWGQQDCLTQQLTQVSALAQGGGYHKLALHTDGTVSAWGCFSSKSEIDVPPDLNSVVAVSTGFLRSLALLDDGTVVMWGSDGGPHLPPSDLSDVVAISAGYQQNLALKSDGSVVAWGVPRDDVEEGLSETHVPDDVEDVVAIAAGRDFNLALRRDGSVVAWGQNSLGQVSLPEGLTDQVGAIAIAAGDEFGAVLLADGTVKAWGGNGAMDIHSHFVDIVEIAADRQLLARRRDGTIVSSGLGIGNTLPTSEFFDVAGVSQDYALVLKQNGEVHSVRGNMPRSFHEVKAVGAGAAHQMVLEEDGTLTVWGIYGGGELAIDADAEISNISDFSTHNRKNVALKDNGTVLTWGDGYFHDTLVEFAQELTGVRAVAAGSSHYLAIIEDDTVFAWGGNNSYGELNIPQALGRVQSIAAGSFHSLALTMEGEVVAWGLDEYGQSSVPEGLRNVVAIAAGQYHSLALRSDGTVESWGLAAMPPSNLSDVQSIQVAPQGGIAIRSDNTAVLWGETDIPPEFHELPVPR